MSRDKSRVRTGTTAPTVASICIVTVPVCGCRIRRWPLISADEPASHQPNPDFMGAANVRSPDLRLVCVPTPPGARGLALLLAGSAYMATYTVSIACTALAT